MEGDLFRNEMDDLIDTMVLESQDTTEEHSIWLHFIARFMLMIETVIRNRVRIKAFLMNDQANELLVELSAIRGFVEDNMERMKAEERTKRTKQSATELGAAGGSSSLGLTRKQK